MYRTHHTDIIVGGEVLELFSQKELNLRMNAEIYDPSEISTEQGDYSFEFELPATPHNCRVFGYANVFDRPLKFMRTFPCQIVADGMTVFDGTLRLSGSTSDSFTANLVQVRKADIEKIFGESKMTDITWRVPFTGTASMNTANADMTTDYFFPLVCYGAWQKIPKATYTIGTGDYTDIRYLDKDTTRLYWESFPPSHRLNALVRRLFEYKGYTVHGTAFEDELLNSIYLSTSMTDKQDPYYPAGLKSIGGVEVTCSATSAMCYDKDGKTYATNLTRNKQSLTYPSDACLMGGTDDKGEYKYSNYENAFVYDVWSQNGFDDGHGSRCSVDNSGNKYMWRDGCVYVPASGYYKIMLYATFSITETGGSDGYSAFYTERYQADGSKTMVQGHGAGLLTNEMKPDLKWCPMEVQIVRNNESVELSRRVNPELWLDLTGMNDTMYPHEQGRIKENSNGMASSSVKSGRTGAVSSGVYDTATVDQWYTISKGVTMAYDPYVNPNFVIGVSSNQEGGAVIKNGKSWNTKCTETPSSRYTCAGYNRIRITNGGSFADENGNYVWPYQTDFITEYNRNTLSTPYTDYYNKDDTNKNVFARVSGVVWLEKGDVLRMKVVTKQQNRQVRWGNSGGGQNDIAKGEMDMSWYCYTRTIIRALTPDKSIYGDPTQTAPLDPSETVMEKGFGKQLDIAQWLNSEQKMADFIKNYIDMFNLRVSINGTDVSIDTQKLDLAKPRAVVDLTDRCYIRDLENLRIDYPKSLEVAFDIDEDEAGFYTSVPDSKIDGDDWKEWAERGSSPVTLDPQADSDPETVEGKFSYCWYDDFRADLTRPIDGGTQSTTVGLSLPLIAKDEHFIIQNADAMQHDGLSLKQRMWFRQKPYTMNDYGGLSTAFQVPMWDGTSMDVTIPVNEKDGLALDYYDKPGSLLRRYFNISASLAGNQVKAEVYLSPQEYKALRDGADVIIGGALHKVCIIEGFDPTGYNKTELTLLRTA